MKGVEWLKNYIKEKSINAKIIEVRRASTVKEAAEELGCSKRQIVKSIVLAAEDEAVIAIVDGTSSVDLKRVEELVGKKVRVAGKNEVLDLIGFPAGGVPPIGHDCKVILDERVLENERVYGGGGDEKHLLLVSPSDIVKDGAVVARIRR
ncbi:aminoacyl-tRNA deacylase [Archaeoglobus profundus]|uniref:YbaK/prolyl-tRNA synthetase associated region n=1 Tax=Archaeoglobus profundus (strain DSM 5631 / JCM 9629 / NBRC 100127 / Av18) TaxID=572546 RepID=D2RI58_ARCPA|nr:YbaK/EbsC family protein [Archaeoglobus profundus]ADB57983.1 YbaK/prolyl-tRNA synthetase associated region [Archaeoglobus profundus DSM 5631]